MDLLELTGRAEARHFWFHGFRRYVAPVVAEAAAGRANLRLIDCGCGTGANIGMLAAHGEAYGFDLTLYGASRARAEQQARAAQADITRIPFATGSFDVATAFDVFQCVPDDHQGMAELARIVRPGGAVIATVAALDVLSGDHGAVWQEVRRYTPASARALLESAGLRVARVSFMFASLFPLMLTVRSAQRMLRPYRPLRADTDIAVPVAPVNAMLTWLVSGEAALARRVPMPIGSSLLLVGTKAG